MFTDGLTVPSASTVRTLQQEEKLHRDCSEIAADMVGKHPIHPLSWPLNS